MRESHLVTGGAGFIGANLVRRLVDSGYGVRVLDNLSRGSASRLKGIKKNLEFLDGDIRNPAVLNKAIKKIDCVWHLAFVNGTEFFYSKPDLVLEVGIKGMMNVIDSCIKEGVRKLMLASSSEVYQTPPKFPADEQVPLSIPDPLNPRYSYAGGKIISELLAINYGRKYFDKVVIFRPHNVYGMDMGMEHVIPQFIVRMKEVCQKNKSKQVHFPIQGTGKETRSFVFIDDFIDGLMLLNEKGEHLGIYNIGTVEEIAIAKVAEKVGEYFGKKIVIIPGKPAKGATLRRCPDISKLKKLGYLPKISFNRGLNLTISWYDKCIEEDKIV